MKINACAKINLFLSVGSTRADGYHDIDTVMHTVSLSDEVTVEQGEGLTLVCDFPVKTEENIAYKAAKLFFEHTGISPDVKITVKKNIPAQAGLGGGSADAAAVLKGLNEYYKAGLDTKTLCALGVKLGADVPFCIVGGKARCKGIGEVITPMEREHLHLLIVKPDVSCPTGEMYKKLDRIERNIPEYREGEYVNSFDEVCPEECKKAVRRLKGTGAKTAMLSGSGSAVFGIFATEGDAEKAYEILKNEYPFATTATTI